MLSKIEIPELPQLMVEEGIKRLREVVGSKNIGAMASSLDDWSGSRQRNIQR